MEVCCNNVRLYFSASGDSRFLRFIQQKQTQQKAETAAQPTTANRAFWRCGGPLAWICTLHAKCTLQLVAFITGENADRTKWMGGHSRRRTLSAGRSLQFKARFTAEAAGGVWPQFSQRSAALGDERGVLSLHTAADVHAAVLGPTRWYPGPQLKLQVFP
ncbi:hypothetical protein EYF80_047642 [Liparis tanakae]|uniref:Uncharacterized protein n=1 Tax=Liparis tanakae TaxID=230148 RepID=A0A4Z2FMU9_9TELE|nr:hypothetical protein EYF80_047642 [Liparis tanakae]